MSLYLRALHEAGHAIVGKAVGHEVYHIHLGNEWGTDYCDGGHSGSAAKDRRLRALVTLGGYFAVAMFGQGLGYDANDWQTAADDWDRFNEYREGMTYRHARNKVTAILRAREPELLALARRVESERDVYPDPHPSEYAIMAVEL